MVKIKWSDFLNPDKKIAINCQTEEEARELIRKLDEIGLRWCDGDSLQSWLCFKWYMEDTCYHIRHDIRHDRFGVGYSGISYFQKNGFDIYTYSSVEFVGDDPEESAEPELSPKKDALTSIAAAMAEICDNLQSDAGTDTVIANSAAMKLLAEAFEIISRTEV